MIVGAQCASLAALGSLLISSSSVLVVNIRAPAGWMIVLVGNWFSDSFAGALVLRRETFAAESTKAVVSRFVGLSQPE